MVNRNGRPESYPISKVPRKKISSPGFFECDRMVRVAQLADETAALPVTPGLRELAGFN